MYTTTPGRLSDLDRLRADRGTDGLRRGFHDMAAFDRKKAIQALNDETLRFPTLFILLPEIDMLDLRKALTARNMTAIQICEKKTNGAGLPIHSGKLEPRQKQAFCRTLRWMLDTGADWDGPQEDYDRYDAAIDTAAALLIRTCGDTGVLPAVCRLIFRRNRKGLLIHDLVWSFLEACNPDVLGMVAKRLLSRHPEDVALACKILHITQQQGNNSRQALYRDYMLWLRENKPYLRFTGEHFLQTSEPVPFVVDPEAKYLGKAISPRQGKPLGPMTREEGACLARFRSAPERDRALLSNYSARIHSRNTSMWQAWLRRPISEQIAAARIELGVKE